MIVCFIVADCRRKRRRRKRRKRTTKRQRDARTKKQIKKKEVEKKKLEKLKKEAEGLRLACFCFFFLEGCLFFAFFFFSLEIDKLLMADVSKRTKKVTGAIKNVEGRSEIYRQRMVMWLNNEAKYLGQWFHKQGGVIEARAQEKINDPSLDDETVDKYLLGEKARIAKAKKVVDDTLQEASTEFLEKEERAVGDMVKGLDKAATDLYKSVTVAKVDLDKNDAEHMVNVRKDLDKGFKKAVVKIYKGVKKGRYDYRQGLYKARKMIQEAKDAAMQLLGL